MSDFRKFCLCYWLGSIFVFVATDWHGPDRLIAAASFGSVIGAYFVTFFGKGKAA